MVFKKCAKILAATIGRLLGHIGVRQRHLLRNLFHGIFLSVEVQNLFASRANLVESLLQEGFLFIANYAGFNTLFLTAFVLGSELLLRTLFAKLPQPVPFDNTIEIGLERAVSLKYALSKVAVEQNDGILKDILSILLILSPAVRRASCCTVEMARRGVT